MLSGGPRLVGLGLRATVASLSLLAAKHWAFGGCFSLQRGRTIARWDGIDASSNLHVCTPYT